MLATTTGTSPNKSPSNWINSNFHISPTKQSLCYLCVCVSKDFSWFKKTRKSYPDLTPTQNTTTSWFKPNSRKNLHTKNNNHKINKKEFWHYPLKQWNTGNQIKIIIISSATKMDWYYISNHKNQEFSSRNKGIPQEKKKYIHTRGGAGPREERLPSWRGESTAKTAAIFTGETNLKKRAGKG